MVKKHITKVLHIAQTTTCEHMDTNNRKEIIDSTLGIDNWASYTQEETYGQKHSGENRGFLEKVYTNRPAFKSATEIISQKNTQSWTPMIQKKGSGRARHEHNSFSKVKKSEKKINII